MPTIHVTIDQVDHSASQGHAREHSLIMDRPEAKGGQNKGPLGGETLLLGLGGCFMSNLLAAAKAREIEISDAKAEIAAELADTPARYTDIHMTVTARCEPSDELEKLVTIAERGCIAVNTLSRAVNLTIICG
ncbi:MAG: OsmC family protein [Sedimenticola sp.]